MSKKFCIIKTEYDNIPGFRDSYQKIIFSGSKKECEIKIKEYENYSKYHSGYGAGSGSVDIYYQIEKVRKEK